MAGHSKFANIKHRKEAQDAKRGKIFSKLVKDITVAAKGNPDPDSNPTLRTMIDKAKQANMPKDNIERALAKVRGRESGEFETFQYGAFGPGGVGMIIEGATDNKNRTLSEIRHILTKNGCNFAEFNAVNWMFVQQDVDGAREWKPNTPSSLSDDDKAKLDTIVDLLEDYDDVDAVSHSGE